MSLLHRGLGLTAGRIFGWRPFSLDPASHLVVAAAVNDVTTMAIVDSGGGNDSSIDRSPKDFSWCPGPDFGGCRVTSNAYGELASGLSLRLGKLELKDLDVCDP